MTGWPTWAKVGYQVLVKWGPVVAIALFTVFVLGRTVPAQVALVATHVEQNTQSIQAISAAAVLHDHRLDSLQNSLDQDTDLHRRTLDLLTKIARDIEKICVGTMKTEEARRSCVQ
jgi:hypothetical protein